MASGGTPADETHRGKAVHQFPEVGATRSGILRFWLNSPFSPVTIHILPKSSRSSEFFERFLEDPIHCEPCRNFSHSNLSEVRDERSNRFGLPFDG